MINETIKIFLHLTRTEILNNRKKRERKKKTHSVNVGETALCVVDEGEKGARSLCCWDEE